MRAWLLFLAVLATFNTFVQVASTEDIITSTLTTILPVVEPHIQTVAVTTTKTTQAEAEATTATTTRPSQLMQRVSRSSETATSTSNALATTRATTALARAFSVSSSEDNSEYEHLAHVPRTVSLRAPDTPSQQATTTTLASHALLYAHSESDKNMLNNYVTDNNLVIEIKNYEEFEGEHTSDTVPTDKVTQAHRTNQLEVAKNNQKASSIKQINNPTNNNSHNKPNQHNQHDNQHTNTNTNANTNANSAVQVQKPNQKHKQKQRTSENNVEKATQQEVMRHAATAELSSTSVAVSSLPAVTAVMAVDLPTSQPMQPPTYNERDEQAESELSTGNSISHSAAGAADDEDDEHSADMEQDDSEPATYSNKEILGPKLEPSPATLVEIENSLLSLFNMKRPPKIDRSKIVIPEAMKQLYAQIMGHELDMVDSVNTPKPALLTKAANTVRSFTHQDSKIDDRFPHHHRFRLHFDISSIPGEEKLKAAELQLSRDAVSHALLNARQSKRTRYQVLVYDIMGLGVRGKSEPNYFLLDSKAVWLNSTESVSLDVQPAVDRWLASPNKNYGLLVEVRTVRSARPAPHHHVRLRRSADEPHASWQHKQPLLFTYTDDGRHKARSVRDVSKRSKRAGGHRRPHRRKNTEENCRRHALFVDFADVGWNDWIVAPAGYDAFYCHGKCPFPLAEHLNSTNHAVVQTLVNNIHPAKAPKACCVPTQLESISMLYLNDQHTVVLKNYQEMTVVGCGCR